MNERPTPVGGAGCRAVRPGNRQPQALPERRPAVAPVWLSSLLALGLGLGLCSPAAQSAITYQGQSSANTGTTAATSLTIAKPTGAAVGEVLVAILGGNTRAGNASAFAAPTGWTVINNTIFGSLNLPAFYHVVQAGDPSSWTWSTTAALPLNGTILRYSGVDTGNPLDIAAAATNSGGTATPIAPSVTTVTAGAQVIRAYVSTESANATANPPTSRVMISVPGWMAHGISDNVKADAGATGTASFSLSASAAGWRAMTFALRPMSAGYVDGTVFRDYNANASQGTREPGIAGITVKAYDASGNVATTTTATDGTYSLQASAGSPAALSGPVRLEFTRGSLSYLQPGVAGGTTVQFVNITTGALGMKVGFSNPMEYSQSNPFVAIPGFYNGTAESAGTRAGIIGFAYNADSFFPTKLTLATAAQVGTTWGVAYQSQKQRLFASTVLNRHIGFSRGPGHVHVVNWTGSAGSYAGSFDLQGLNPANGGAAIDLGSVCRQDTISGGGPTCGSATNNGLGAVNAPNYDVDAFDKVGKVSFGDADLDDGQDTLWLVNLNQRALISVDVSGGFTDGTVPGAVNQYPIAGLPGVPSCTNGTLRPWGLKFHEGQGYLGVVCSEESSGSNTATANLRAYVLRFDPANVGAGFTTVLNFPLNYSRYASYSGGWRPWTSLATFPGTPFPQPILSDLEFAEDGSLRIGMMDRLGMQMSGSGNWRPYPPGTEIEWINSVGELLEACLISGSYVMEGLPGCPGKQGYYSSSSGQNSGPYQSGYRFLQKANDGGRFPAQGGLGWLPGSGEVMTNMYDPYPSSFTPGSDSSYYGFEGTGRYNAATGSHVAGVGLIVPPVQGGACQLCVQGKSNGLGDLEFLVDAAPLEIGNRVWNDANHNGVQDPGEAVLPGVTVTLKNAAGTVISSAVTDASGHYYFSNGTGTSTGSAKYGLSGLTASTTGFQLVIASADPGLLGLSATLPNNDATTDGDLRDSDGIVSGSDVIATFDTGRAGNNNHTYDFGFYSGSPTVEYSVGDKIFWDYNNDGVLNGTDVGIPGVVVQLQVWDGTAWVQASDINGDPVANQTTDSTGYYLFEHLALNNPANPYRVVVLPSNFSNPLYGALSSGPDSTDFTGTGNNKDHGIGTQPQSYGIVSPSFDLNGLPSGVYHLPTVDFGFTRKSINTAPDLAFTSAASPASVAPGGTSTVTLTGSAAAGGGQVTKAPAMTETLPAGLTVAGTGTGFTSADGKWTCRVNTARTQVSCGYIGSLPVLPGNSLGQAQFPVTVAAGASSGSTLTASGSITKLTGEPNYANNVHSVAVTVQ